MKLMPIIAMCAMLCGCSTHKECAEEQSLPPVVTGNTAHMPNAVIYRTNGDYAQCVAVNVSADGKKLVSYPAPTDVSAESSALPIGDGWLLDRRGGIGLNTRFLRMNYAEYSRLDKVPTHAELLEMIIPEARVEEVQVLPIKAADAIAHPEKIKR